MSTEDLRAAADRLRRYEAGDVSAYPANNPNLQVVYDVGTLKSAYLAEHPADDDEPVTEEWLRAVGFETAPNSSFLIRSSRYDHLRLACKIDSSFPPYPHWVVGDYNPDDYGIEVAVPPPSTRGRVRRLCSALGITLKESP